MALRRNLQASQHQFSMVPRPDVPRSTYSMQQTRKTTFNGGFLVPIYCEEMLPGDHFKCAGTIFARLATPIVPVLDNAQLETFFFFVPNRLVWEKWESFIGGGNYTVPVIRSPTGGFAQGEIYDQLGLPTTGQIDGGSYIEVNALPLRAYNLIWNEWFRDENLMSPQNMHTGAGPDPAGDYKLMPRAKKHDYFTSALPWPQKGTAVTMPMLGQAPVIPDLTGPTSGAPSFYSGSSTGRELQMQSGITTAAWGPTPSQSGPAVWEETALVADLSLATAATINSIRLAFQVQKLLERDARGGTRYTELIQSHFGVRPADYRLQRPEYVGGGRSRITTTPVPQTSSTDATTPQGNLAAFTTTGGGGHGYSYAATEHGYIIGIAQVRCDLSYQQGIRRHWSRQTRYDYYFPAFAHLGEQAILNKEIFATGLSQDNQAFGYQERWAEYRYTPNEICGRFRSTSTTPIDVWHYAEKFNNLPTLNWQFLSDYANNQLSRSMAVGAGANGEQILLDSLFVNTATRPLPTYSVPGLIDHF